MTINQADFFLDFKQFGELKLQARSQSDDAARTVAQQFEGLFLQQMLATMRSAALIDTEQHSSHMDFYQEMYDKQLAQTIAGQGRLGVAGLILGQMPTPAAESGAPANADNALPKSVQVTATALQPRADSVSAAAVQSAARPEAGAANTAVVLNKVLDDDFAEVSLNQAANPRWQDPRQFVADVWPQAQEAAGQIGVSASLLVAQAALETGWGKHTMQLADGRSSHNLFGIKAGPGWQGPSLAKPSLEFRDGVLQTESSRFRAYDSAAQSLADYVDFIRGNPRYAGALDQAGDDRAYIEEIQRAGYATDPEYADKVIGIMQGDLLQQALADLNTGESDYA